jgi:hypothetical protein
MPAKMNSGVTKDLLTRYALGIATVIAVINLFPTLSDAFANATGLPAVLSITIVGTFVGIGLLLFIIEVFLP